MIEFGSLIFWIALVIGLLVPAAALGYGGDRDDDIPVWFVALWLTGLTIVAHFVVDSLPLPQLSTTTWLLGFGAYLAIGLGWSAFRWYQDMVEVKAALATLRKDTTRQSMLGLYGFRSDPPSPRDCPRRIGSRIAYWPFLIVAEFTSIFSWVGQLFDFVFRAITNRVFRDASV
ncbi:hypothetical protein KNJ79_04965 [Sphingopyxis indica]|uniref:hypothetical protein n=1 Tax=Sphingopyxis indica TaxID=436663 RepID=UPI002939252D|nr:hypothetical protein [Sphingopyxis indica]WOF44282.1 hypothetical protein KNJ79_04965 [Sphingopyxis indica]